MKARKYESCFSCLMCGSHTNNFKLYLAYFSNLVYLESSMSVYGHCIHQFYLYLFSLDYGAYKSIKVASFSHRASLRFYRM